LSVAIFRRELTSVFGVPRWKQSDRGNCTKKLLQEEEAPRDHRPARLGGFPIMALHWIRLRAVRPALLAALVALAPSGARAEAGPVPERRVVVETGVDFYGGDLRSIYGTSLAICRDVCLAEPELWRLHLQHGRAPAS
jgi:hypothetical protein